MMIEDLQNYQLEVDENYYRVWTKGKRHHINMHPVTRYEIEKGMDIPGIIGWLRISRIIPSKEGGVRGIMLSYKDGEYKRRTITVSMDKERTLRVISMDIGFSDFTFRVVKKDQEE